MRRKGYQEGSLQSKKQGPRRVWVAFWWGNGVRVCKTLGRQSQMTKADAEIALAAMPREVNAAPPRRPGRSVRSSRFRPCRTARGAFVASGLYANQCDESLSVRFF